MRAVKVVSLFWRNEEIATITIGKEEPREEIPITIHYLPSMGPIVRAICTTVFQALEDKAYMTAKRAVDARPSHRRDEW